MKEISDHGGIARVRIWGELEPWVITNHELARQALTNEALSSNSKVPGFPDKSPSFGATFGQHENLRTMDNPQHSMHRKMLMPEFTAKRIRGMRTMVEDIVDQAIDDLLAAPQPADFVTNVALPIPVNLFCTMMGVPNEDSDMFVSRVDACLSDRTIEDAVAAHGELAIYLGELVDAKMQNPTDDFTSRLVGHVHAGNLTRHEAVDTLLVVIGGGHETTAGMLTMSMLVILERPELAAELRATEDDTVIANCVEELLRYLNVSQSGRRRIALRDVEIGGKQIKAGEGVVVLSHTADRDASVFPYPDVLDIHRSEARRHTAFGYGMHQCLGQHLARLEIQTALPRILKRIPSLELAIPRTELVFKETNLTYSVATLPLVW